MDTKALNPLTIACRSNSRTRPIGKILTQPVTFATPTLRSRRINRSTAAVIAAVVALAVIGLLGLLGLLSSTASDIAGEWRLDVFTINGETSRVSPGSNTPNIPWLLVENETMAGNAGCNDFSGSYSYKSRLLETDLIKDAALCGPESGQLMKAEKAFEAVVWGNGQIVVEFNDNQMIWSAEANSLMFVRSDDVTHP